MPPRKRQEPPPSQTGMADHAENEAILSPIISRDDSKDIIYGAVAGLGGVSKTAKVLGKSVPTIWTYLYGTRQMPSEVADRLAVATAATVDRQVSLVHSVKRLAADARAREAAFRNASRERYFQRFGRYPVPARGNKTP